IFSERKVLLKRSPLRGWMIKDERHYVIPLECRCSMASICPDEGVIVQTYGRTACRKDAGRGDRHWKKAPAAFKFRKKPEQRLGTLDKRALGRCSISAR